jgi:hypothetical protein
MGSTMNVNGKTVVHAGSGGKSIAFPDSCKTPTPGGPAPMPYPNTAMSSDASSVTTSVKVDGNGICVDGSKFALSMGDEAGTLLGVKSNRIKGSASFTSFSDDVKAEGKAVARLSDPMQQNEGIANADSPAELQGPLIVVDASKLAKSQAEACDMMREKAVPNASCASHAEAAVKAGILQQDYDAMRRTCQAKNVTCSFRDTNAACTPHLAAGMESKGHDVLTKTFPEENLKPEDKHLAGTVSTLDKKPPKGEIIDNAPTKQHGPPPLTGDYDMMDMLDSNGKRIKGESPQDHAVRKQLNDALPPAADGKQHDRIKHGAQAEYGNYMRSPHVQERNQRHQEHNDHVDELVKRSKITKEEGENLKLEVEKPISSLMKPEKPLTVFDKDGKVYRLETEEDAMNFYKCKGAEIPPEWHVSTESKLGKGTKLSRIT